MTTDCRPQQLLEYLHGEAARAASAAAVAQVTARSEEEQLLEAARSALGAKHMIRVCSTQEHPTVSKPLQRLIQNAGAVRQAVDLSGEEHIVLLIMCHSCPSYHLHEQRPQLQSCKRHWSSLSHVQIMCLPVISAPVS